MMTAVATTAALSRLELHCCLNDCNAVTSNRHVPSLRWKAVVLLLVVSVSSSTDASFVSTRCVLYSADCQRTAGHQFLGSTSLWAVNKDDTQLLKSRTKRRERKKLASGNNRNHESSVPRQTWRVFGVNVHPDLLADSLTTKKKDTTVDKLYLEPPVLQALQSRLRIQKDSKPKLLDVRVVRRSLDARKTRRSGEEIGPRYTYVLDIDVTGNVASQLRFRNQPGRMELLSETSKTAAESVDDDTATSSGEKPRIVIVGAGPAGLFCALILARSGLVTPILLERGQPVEARGKHIGALIHRRSLDSESNFAFGEGGAGTWSDGKLTTRIGRNSGAVRFVLETLVLYGAPRTILVDGSPHLGTDNLVRLLRNMRHDLQNLGGEVRFGAKMTDLVIEGGIAKGVHVKFSEAVERSTDNDLSMPTYSKIETIMSDAVVLATGHSARDVYEELHAAGVQLEAKGFAVGFRVEHPQKIINKIQYGNEWGPSVVTGKSVTDVANQDYFSSMEHDPDSSHPGRLPVPSYRLATDKAYDGKNYRGAYSFCMCPGGQIVPSSTDPGQVCVNGMSFSKRDSIWANSALVVTVSPEDEILENYSAEYGVLAGVEFQKDMERRAYELGGGNLTVPVQRLTDFVQERASTSAPPSSYRLGVKPAACHEIYPKPLFHALRDAVVNNFAKQMPGFLCDDALLHAVETRTSSPVRVSRDDETLQAVGTERLFPAGEGAGFAGGIVSAAVDGIVVAEAVLELVHGSDGRSIQWKRTTKSVGYNY